MIFTVDGIDIVPYIAADGIKWTNNGVDGQKAGRAMDALMYRGLIGYKARGDISCLWMKKEDAVNLYQSLMKEFFSVTTDTIPWENGTVTKTMYANNMPATLSEEYTDGTKIYQDLTFPLVER